MIAINMKMPENCVECRFGRGDYGFCHAMPENFCGYVNQLENEGKPDWCPLRQVDRLAVEHVFNQEDFDRFGKDTIKRYLVDTAGRKIGDKIVGDMMCEWESKPIDPEIMPLGTHVRTTVSIVRPEINGECLI